MLRLGWIGLVLVVFLPGCGAARVVDYRARAAVAEQDWGDRLHLEWAGIRVLVGPPAVFPYAEEGEAGERVSGQYQLFTRVMVENVGRERVEVHWPEARLAGPGGECLRLVESGEAAARALGVEPAPSAPVEALEPGERAFRVLIPETLYRIEVDEAMVSLCDGCEYRLVVPVRVGGREERLELPFRLHAQRPPRSSARFFWSRFDS